MVTLIEHYEIHANPLICTMPFYRMHIKLDGQEVREFNIEDPRKAIDIVYLDYKKRVNSKNGTGRVIYFDLVMIAEASLSHQGDRDEVFNAGNNYGVNPFNKLQPWRKNKRKSGADSFPTLEERRG